MAEKETTKAPAAKPEWKGSMSASEPLVAPDGHVTVSQEDIDKRDEES